MSLASHNTDRRPRTYRADVARPGSMCPLPVPDARFMRRGAFVEVRNSERKRFLALKAERATNAAIARETGRCQTTIFNHTGPSVTRALRIERLFAACNAALGIRGPW